MVNVTCLSLGRVTFTRLWCHPKDKIYLFVIFLSKFPIYELHTYWVYIEKQVSIEPDSPKISHPVTSKIFINSFSCLMKKKGFFITKVPLGFFFF